MYAELIRKHFHTLQTRGEFILYNDTGRVLFNAKTLELDVDGNKENESCVLEGEYDMIPLINRPEGVKYRKESVGYFPYLIKDVPNREGIFFHHGNFYSDILGCVLVGQEFVDIDGDGLLDVTNSKKTMIEMNKVLKQPVPLAIKRSAIGRKGLENVYIHN